MKVPPERLGSFYLGAEYDLNAGKPTDIPLNYDARDLTTHAVCVGMTGSGKTGLCLDLLEEAIIDDVPTLIIDPKGDITNLMLQFPDLKPEDFQPWVNPDDARRKGKTIAEYATAIAETWRNGLADWGQGPERIQRLKDASDLTVYTPGSDAGVPISILGSLAAPALDFDQHTEEIRERISGTVMALLGLLGIKADPIRSREAILLSNIFEHFWKQGEDLDLARLILSVQNPPIRQLGVFDVDTFYPEKDRFELAMSFNGLVASPSFKSWLEGDALDVDSLLYDADGSPRHSIFYIAHLSDSERMFFVTLLLENIVTWMRNQTGTTSLRAIVYFDEIFGFFPPTAEPPSKRPLLTLLKQARAFGLGCVLVTQNPVDIDYKGLSNAGTWFIGKLQTDRDKARVLQGLEGAIAEAGKSGAKVDYDAMLSRLDSRVFLMHNVHEDEPVLFHTRWAMSYLRGPLSKLQVQKLMADRKQAKPTPVQQATATAARPQAAAAPVAAASARPEAPEGFTTVPPTLDPDVRQVFVPLSLNSQGALQQATQETGANIDESALQLVYEPAIVGAASVRFVDRRRQISHQQEKMLLAPAPFDEHAEVDWETAESLPVSVKKLTGKPARVRKGQGPFFAAVPEAANSARELKSISRSLSDWLYYNVRLPIKVHAELKLFQKPDESNRAFRLRLEQAAREARDAEVDKLEKKYETDLDRLEAKLRKLDRSLAQDEAKYDARKREEMVGIGETVLGLFTKRRRSYRAISTAASKRRMTQQAKMEIEDTKDEIEDIKEDMAELEAELKEATEEITKNWVSRLEQLGTDELAPRRTDVNIKLVALAWLPSWRVVYQDGDFSESITLPAYALPDEAE